MMRRSNKAIFRLFITVFSVCAFIPAIRAQPAQVIFENYTLENGLPNNTVHQAFQDRRGFMWFATNHGVCRYDGYRFTSFRNDPLDSTSLAGLLARVIFEDKKGNLWIGTESGGLNRFNREKETFEHILNTNSVTGIGTSVKAIAEDTAGRLWLGTNKGIKLFNPVSGQVKSYPFIANSPHSPSDTYVRELQFDQTGRLWVGTNAGLDIFDPVTETFIRVYTFRSELRDEIWDIYCDPDGLMWIGTYNKGLFTVQPHTLETHKIDLDEKKEWSNTIRSVVRDAQGLYWVASRAGLFIYNAGTRSSAWFGNVENELNSLVNNSVLHIYRDASRNLWLSTRGGVSLMVPERQHFRHYKALRNSRANLNNNEVYAAWADPTNNYVYIGTGAGGVNILDRKTQQFHYLTHQPGNSNSVAGNEIKAFLEDGKGNLWIGTYKSGISLYNFATKRFSHFRHNPSDPGSVSSNSVWALYKDRKGNIWVGSDEGLDLYDERSKNFIHHRINGKNEQVAWIGEDSDGNLWLGLQSIVSIYDPGSGAVRTIREQGSCFYEDSKGRRWLATRNNGIVLFGANDADRKYFDERDGLPNNQAFQILEDGKGNLWISTANGLAMFDPDAKIFTNFDKKDGLQSNQFHYGASFKLNSGELVFGGVNGFSMFNPAEIVKDNYHPPVVLTSLKIFNKSVRIGDQFGILNSTIAETSRLVIPYKYNILTLEFAALNYVRPEKNMYQFRLEGFDSDWNDAGTKTAATYTNLDPGNYTFWVRAARHHGAWNEAATKIELVILPPFWRTWWFLLLATVTILTFIYYILKFIINRQKMKQQLESERTKVRQMNEVNALKFRFFTNISHEIRTPLTLIIGPLERLMQSDLPPSVLRSQIAMMHRNASSLLKLVNQLLDFKKLESGTLRLELNKGDIILFVREIVQSFMYLAEDKGIQLKFSSPSERIVAYFDSDKLEKILNNLLSNALKFTGRQGTVSVYVHISVDSTFDSYSEWIELIVKDTGVGIGAENRKKIFQRFFQVGENKHDGGTGIGLSLTQELVKLHKGEILVESELTKGSRFIVRIPLLRQLSDGGVMEVAETESAFLNEENAPRQKDDLMEENILLVVEDNADVRQFIRQNFEAQFHVVEAADGSEGLQLAKKLLPDIILSDVMMPGMDGNELCRRLKNDEYTSHIPVILLTALSSKKHTIEGLTSGADDYITKPFDVSILQAKIDNLLQLARSMRRKYEVAAVNAAGDASVAEPEEDPFLLRAIDAVEENLSDPDLDIERFSKIMAVSRMQMYRKLSALTGMTVKEFIRDIRLKHAAVLLEQKKLNVSEVAYAVGFSDLSYFRKCFREKYGMSATDYLRLRE